MKNVALIFGGRGFESGVSRMGFSNVYPQLLNNGYRVIPVYIDGAGRWRIPNEFASKGERCGECDTSESEDYLPNAKEAKNRKNDRIKGAQKTRKVKRNQGEYYSKFLMPSLEAEAFERYFTVAVAPADLGEGGGLAFSGGFIPIAVAFPLLHGDHGENGEVQGALESASIRYVGENASVSAVCLDKRLTRLIANELKIPVARGFSFAYGDDVSKSVRRAASEIGYPLFVKPADLGSSYGASAANDEQSLISAIDTALSFSNKIIIEEKLDIDCELEVAVLSVKGKLIFTKPSKITTDIGSYDYDRKYSGAGNVILDPVADEDEDTLCKIAAYARSLAEFLNIRSLCRIDFFKTRGGDIIFNEINTMPGFTGGSLYTEMIARYGISSAELFDILLEGAL